MSRPRERERERERKREERGSIVWHLGHLDHGLPPQSRVINKRAGACRQAVRPREANDDNHGLWEQTMAMTATAMRPLTTRGRARCQPTGLHAWPPPSSSPEGRGDYRTEGSKGGGLSGDRMDINWYVHAAKVPQFSSRYPARPRPPSFPYPARVSARPAARRCGLNKDGRVRFPHVNETALQKRTAEDGPLALPQQLSLPPSALLSISPLSCRAHRSGKPLSASEGPP